MRQEIKKPVKIKFKKGDIVKVIAGKDKGKEGKVLKIDRVSNRLVVEGVNMITKHQKANQRSKTQGGIIHFEGSIHASNVMFINNGKVTRIGYRVDTVEKNGKQKNVRVRIDKKTEQEI